MNQDEHKIPIDELVKRLETNLDTVSMSLQVVINRQELMLLQFNKLLWQLQFMLLYKST